MTWTVVESGEYGHSIEYDAETDRYRVSRGCATFKSLGTVQAARDILEKISKNKSARETTEAKRLLREAS